MRQLKQELPAIIMDMATVRVMDVVSTAMGMATATDMVKRKNQRERKMRQKNNRWKEFWKREETECTAVL